MIASHFPDGPYLHAVGWTAAGFEPVVATSDRWSGQQVGLARAEKHPGTSGSPIELPTVLLRASGVPRARSAPRSSVYAALLGAKLRSTLAPLSPANHRVGVAAVSSSAIVPICFAFEGAGVAMSWDATDTMLLPASIPTTVGTSVARATGSHASAVTYGDGAQGMVAAIEHAHVSLHMGRTDAWLLVAAEEFAQSMVDALQQLGDAREAVDGSAGLVLAAAPLSDSDWQVRGIAQLDADESVEKALHPDWRTAARIRIALDSPLMAYTSLSVAWALHAAVTAGAACAVIELAVDGRGAQLLALGGPHGSQSAPFTLPGLQG